jgi:DNA-binding Lrp family transcriptional regulator
METVNIKEIEYRLLNLLIEDAGRNLSELSRELGVSKATVSRMIKSLKERGIIKKFSIELGEDLNEERIFAFLRIRGGDIGNVEGDLYKLLDGSYLLVITGKDIGEIEEEIEKVSTRVTINEVLISTSLIKKARKSLGIKPISLHCDYCNHEIEGNPLILKFRGKIYYLCCNTCLREKRRALGIS